jgi:uncharacterized protein YndB with AHSA1/START domain/uncharacterized protein YciI
MTKLPPIRRQVVVPAGPLTAFDVFTAEIGSWWPLERFSVYGPKATTAFRDGRLVETGPDGDESEWATVLDWDPPRRLRLSWYPGRSPASSTVVEVTFAPVTETQTLVTVTHDDWERFAEPAASRTEYGNGWLLVLGRYTTSVEPDGDSGTGPVYLVLTHTPAPGIGNPLEHPEFAGHTAFLESLRERGILVAAGPFPGSGEGMTVVRLDDPGEIAAMVAEAREGDASVVDGVLEVRVRPWIVVAVGTGTGVTTSPGA